MCVRAFEWYQNMQRKDAMEMGAHKHKQDNQQTHLID